MNEEITAKEVRLIAEDGTQIGIVPIKEALERARAANLDLVEISPNANPVVCKLINYGKFLYQKEKKAKEAKKKQKTIEIKEFKLRPVIDKHDFSYRIVQMRNFLQQGNMVKITVRFKGREVAHTDMGFNLTDRIISELKDVCVVEKPAKMEGKNIVLILGPTKEKKKQ